MLVFDDLLAQLSGRAEPQTHDPIASNIDDAHDH
jgi:hypothetical protein